MKTNNNVTINKDYLREIIKKAVLTQKDFANTRSTTNIRSIWTSCSRKETADHDHVSM